MVGEPDHIQSKRWGNPRSLYAPSQYCSDKHFIGGSIGDLGTWGNGELPTSLSPYIPIPPPINKRYLSEQYWVGDNPQDVANTALELFDLNYPLVSAKLRMSQ